MAQMSTSAAAAMCGEERGSHADLRLPSLDGRGGRDWGGGCGGGGEATDESESARGGGGDAMPAALGCQRGAHHTRVLLCVRVPARTSAAGEGASCSVVRACVRGRSAVALWTWVRGGG